MPRAADPILETPWVVALSRLVRDRLGYDAPPHRMIREIAPFVVAEAEARGFDGPETLVDGLDGRRHDELWQDLVGVVSIGETYFFRHAGQVEAMAAVAARLHAAVRRPLRIWSAGCATGEEAWTVAMRLMAEDVPCEVTASDVNVTALSRASAGGPYSDRCVGHLPEAHRERYLVADDAGRWRLTARQELPVRFVRHNLISDRPLRPVAGRWDLLLCRNVLLYFSREMGREVIEGLGTVLGREGSLWVAPCDHADLAGDLVWDHEGRERYLRHVREEEAQGVATMHALGPSRPAPRLRVERPRGAAGGAWPADLEAHLDRGLGGGALEVVERRVADRPDDGTAWVARAAFYLSEHAFGDALSALDRARATHPRPEGLAYFRGTALLKAGRAREALTSFLEAVEDDPDDWASSWQAADIYRRTGRTLLEELMLRRTLELLDADTPEAPSFGPAAVIVNSVHRDPIAVRRRVRDRLALHFPNPRTPRREEDA